MCIGKKNEKLIIKDDALIMQDSSADGNIVMDGNSLVWKEGGSLFGDRFSKELDCLGGQDPKFMKMLNFLKFKIHNKTAFYF